MFEKTSKATLTKDLVKCSKITQKAFLLFCEHEEQQNLFKESGTLFMCKRKLNCSGILPGTLGKVTQWLWIRSIQKDI